MIDVAHRSSAEPTSSNAFRDAILARHDVLRGLVADAVHLADRRPRARRDVDRLRARARDLYLTLDANLSFEARAFPVALRDVVGWGAVLQEEIHEVHARQRRALASALSGLRPKTVSWSELVRDVRDIAASVIQDLEREEAALLNADLDALANDSEGG
jgi:hypothetical protein